MNTRTRLSLLATLATLSACTPLAPDHAVIPAPTSFAATSPDSFHVTPNTPILFDPGDATGERVANLLAGLIGNSRETTPAVRAATDPVADSSIYITRRGADADLGPEGYTLTISPTSVRLYATHDAGLFYGVQTIRQLLPAYIEYAAALPRPLHLPTVSISDAPRFAWRGSMLDISRHFFGPDDIKRYIDLLALYKFNRLHLHLSDDQGWRIAIASWPDLTRIGSRTEVGGGEGGFLSAEDYADIVAYAADRFITIVPEIDMPGHTNAALASYAELNCDGVARAPYTGIEVGFSSLCIDKDVTYRFIDEVVREIAAMTPGAYFHVGGDEVHTLGETEYAGFIDRVQDIVTSHGKRMVGWDEVALADLSAGSVVQLWRPLWTAEADSDSESEADSARVARLAAFRARIDHAAAAGVTFILSPADRLYLDMKYEPSTVPGLSWAAFVDERRAYDWKVGDVFAGIPEDAIEGVEAPIWTETLGTMADIEYMAFPRLAGVAELGWSTVEDRDWADYQARVRMHQPRWQALGINYRR